MSVTESFINGTFVKPADETPRSAVRIVQLATRAGLPPGIFNVVTLLGPRPLEVESRAVV